MKRLISSFILISLLAGLASCGSESGSNDISAEQSSAGGASDETETADSAISDNLPDKDYNGYDFRILMRCTPIWTKEMFVDEATGDVVDDAVYRRNQIVSERFGVNFTLIESSNTNYELDGVNAILAGDDAYDLIAAHGHAAFTYAQQGLLLDWKTELPYVDLDKPWWDQDARDSFEINNKLYAMVGDLSYNALAYSDCMLFNKNLFDKYNEEYPFQKVIDGTWTFDEFSRLVKVCSADLNGDNKLDPNDDLYGYATYIWVGPVEVLYTGGGRVMTKNADGGLELCYNTERNIDVYNTFFNLLKDDSCYLEPDRSDYQSLRRTMFFEGRALMIDGNLNEVSYMRDMKDDFGIVPWPKFDSSCDGYAANVDAGTNIYLVPITVSDPERNSIILEALSAEGNRIVIPAYYETALQKKYTRDDISVKMIDIIRESRIFDIGYYYRDIGYFSWGGRALCDYPDHSFASFYAKNEPTALATIKEVNENYGKQ